MINVINSALNYGFYHHYLDNTTTAISCVQQESISTTAGVCWQRSV